MESVVPSSFPSNLSAECGSTRESESLGGRRARLQLQQIRRPSNHYQRRHRKSHGDGTKIDGITTMLNPGYREAETMSHWKVHPFHLRSYILLGAQFSRSPFS